MQQDETHTLRHKRFASHGSRRGWTTSRSRSQALARGSAPLATVGRNGARPHRSRTCSRSARSVLTSALLALAAVVPAASIAAEPDRSQEGGTSPEHGQGVDTDSPSFDPGGDTDLPFDTGPPVRTLAGLLARRRSTGDRADRRSGRPARATSSARDSGPRCRRGRPGQAHRGGSTRRAARSWLLDRATAGDRRAGGRTCATPRASAPPRRAGFGSQGSCEAATVDCGRSSRPSSGAGSSGRSRRCHTNGIRLARSRHRRGPAGRQPGRR